MSRLPYEKPVTFLDFEASGTEGYPIEIGWAIFDPADGTVCVESHLIRPTEEWLEQPWLWDEVAEDIHGIRQLDLKDGVRVEDVCARANECLSGRTVYCDGFRYDLHWLEMLYDAAWMRPSFHLADADQIFRYIDPVVWSAAELNAERLCPRTHRAGGDAKHLAVFWQLVLEGGG